MAARSWRRGPVWLRAGMTGGAPLICVYSVGRSSRTSRPSNLVGDAKSTLRRWGRRPREGNERAAGAWKAAQDGGGLRGQLCGARGGEPATCARGD